MRRKSRNRPPSAFTLLELVVVLAILSLVTALAFRSIDQVQDQTRYEANNRLMRDIERAVVGSLDDRAIDGSPTISGFVADMGRLPKTVTVLIDENPALAELTLAELWLRPDTDSKLYSIRKADETSGVFGLDRDPDIRVATGWRGPYITPPTKHTNLLDGWGNSIRSLPTATPINPSTTGYHRLRNGTSPLGDPIIEEAQSIEIVEHLGGNGREDPDLPLSPIPPVVDRDVQVDFRGRFSATVTTSVEVLESDGSPSTNSGTVVVRVFGPDPNDITKIKVDSGEGVVNTALNMSNVASVTASPATTIGPRVVRAYLDGTFKSSVKHVTLRPGVNFVPLTIYR